MSDQNNFLTNNSFFTEKPGDKQFVTLRYGLWDVNQSQVYQTCADRFHEKFPNIRIKIEQVNWDNYWRELERQFQMKTAPDVFVTHVSQHHTFVIRDFLIDLEPLVKRDRLDLSIYQQRLAELWVKNEHRYALPKDWDTVAVVYNTEMFAKAGINTNITQNWTWNAQNTGTFNECIARLTLDKKGNNSLDPKFDKINIAQYGIVTSWGNSPAGQVGWGNFAMSNGALPLVNNLLGPNYTYSDPRRIEAIQWYADLSSVKKVAPLFDGIAGLGTSGLENHFFIEGKAAIFTDGSWDMSRYITECNFKVGFAMMPIGPVGRKTLLNGLGDSIWTGTKYPEEAWQWVKFLGSSEAQDIVAESGVVFPAITTSTQKTLNRWMRLGVDVSAFAKMAQNPAETFLYAPNTHNTEVHSIINPTLNLIMLGVAKAAPTLITANEKINALFR